MIMTPIISKRFRIVVSVSVGTTGAYLFLCTFPILAICAFPSPGQQGNQAFEYLFFMLLFAISLGVTTTMFVLLTPPGETHRSIGTLRLLRAWMVLNLVPLVFPLRCIPLWNQQSVFQGIGAVVAGLLILWSPDIVVKYLRLGGEPMRWTPRRRWSRTTNLFVVVPVFLIVLIATPYAIETIFGNALIRFLTRLFISEAVSLALIIGFCGTVAYLVARGLLVLLEWKRIPLNALVCDGCGYDLTGNLSGKCPECGIPSRAIMCEKCGYVLSGNTSGVCPECGIAISSGVAPLPSQ